MQTKAKLTDKDRLTLNSVLAELIPILEEIQTAMDAGITEVEPLGQLCSNCIERIKGVKATYFPGKK